MLYLNKGVINLLKRSLNQVLLSGRLGDGCLVDQSGTKRFYAMYSSVNLDYLQYKRDVLGTHIVIPKIRERGNKGYKKGSTIYSFCTPIHSIISDVGNLTKAECIQALNKEGLVMLFLDDGTFHQRKHFMHIYCNTFTEEECEALIEKIHSFYPQKRAVIRYDRKKDGRVYPYLYLSVCVAKEFAKDVRKFIEDNDIPSLLYKVGG